jgi:predicted dithiol-disulfide oxidoreductase (DUF899 family)
MATFDVVTPDAWAAARAELRAREIEEAEARAAVNAARRRLPATAVEQEYVLDGPAGPVTLAGAFEGRPQLILYHFMFHPSWSQGCPYCSHVIDNIGHLAHMNALGTTFATVSRAPQAKIQPFRQRMGWQHPWYSDASGDFNRDFDATDDRGAINVFLRDGDAVYRTYTAYDDAIDLHLLDYSYLDLTPLGLAPGGPWPRHHDRYGS